MQEFMLHELKKHNEVLANDIRYLCACYPQETFSEIIVKIRQQEGSTLKDRVDRIINLDDNISATMNVLDVVLGLVDVNWMEQILERTRECRGETDFLAPYIELVKRRVPASIIEEIATNRYYIDGLKEYEALRYLVSVQGLLTASETDSMGSSLDVKEVAETRMLSMLPKEMGELHEVRKTES